MNWLEVLQLASPIIKDLAPLFSFLGVCVVAYASWIIARRMESHKFNFKRQEIRFNNYCERQLQAFEKIDESIGKLLLEFKVNSKVVVIVAEKLMRDNLSVAIPDANKETLKKANDNLTQHCQDLMGLNNANNLLLEEELSQSVAMFTNYTITILKRLENALNEPIENVEHLVEMGKELEKVYEQLDSKRRKVAEEMRNVLKGQTG